MSEPTSPVQPLDSAGSDQRLANMLADAKIQPAQAASAQGPVKRVEDHLCPNCANGRGVEVELDDEGTCQECGFSTAGRLM